MIKIHLVSPENEARVAERLRDLIVQAWPDLAESRRDRIDILVGLRLPADVDVLVILDLDSAREVPPQVRRLGGSSPAAMVQYGLIAIDGKATRHEPIRADRKPVVPGL
jgi:hypothetical protein